MVTLIQLLSLGAVVELFVQCMPGTLRRASKQNKFRLDGSLSENRAYREQRARNRLRLDLLAVFVLVFLTGNALYYTIDSLIMPVSGIFHRWLVADVPEASMTLVASQAEKSWETQGNNVITLSMVWLVACLILIAAGVMRAYRSFATGVHERSAENFHLDMTRMSISSSDIAAEILAGQPGSDRSATAG